MIYKLEVELKESPNLSEAVNYSAEMPDKKQHKLNDLTPQSDLSENPIIVGTGPAGIMAAYLLAQYGCKPIIIDRGYNVEKRWKEKSYETGRLVVCDDHCGSCKKT